MASSSGSGESGGSGSGGGRRYPHNLEGLLRFSAEHSVSAPENTTSTTATTPTSNLTNIDPESINPIHHPSHGNPSHNEASNDPKLARRQQDRALEVLGLHRYRVAGDGNCLFRAVAWQLKLDQEKYHPILRRAAVVWMRANKTELLEWGLLDGEKEIEETEGLGVWPGQAAIVALANIFRFNIAVIQGGDKGDIDIQHICPFETTAQAEGEQGSVILAYLYNGHYDAVVEEPNLENPEFEAWTIRRDRECEADEALARKLASEECSSTLPSSYRLPSPGIADKVQQHVSEVFVSSHTQPLRERNLENPPLVRSFETSGRNPVQKACTTIASKPSRPALPTVMTKCPDKPRRSPPRKALSEDESHSSNDNQMRITLYSKKQASLDEDFSESKRYLYKPALTNGETPLHVFRREPDTDVLQQRQIRDVDPLPPQRISATSIAHRPSIRITPLMFVGNHSPRRVSNVAVGSAAVQQSREAERSAATCRREYVERGPAHTWTQTSTERYGEHVSPRQHPVASTVHSKCIPTYDMGPLPRPTVLRHYNYDQPAISPTYDRSAMISTTSQVSGRLPRTHGPHEMPVMVLSARSPKVSHGLCNTRVRAIPTPATYDLNKPFDMPPQLKPYKSIIAPQDIDLLLK